jgi:hypothetical protein
MMLMLMKYNAIMEAKHLRCYNSQAGSDFLWENWSSAYINDKEVLSNP